MALLALRWFARPQQRLHHALLKSQPWPLIGLPQHQPKTLIAAGLVSTGIADRGGDHYQPCRCDVHEPIDVLDEESDRIARSCIIDLMRPQHLAIGGQSNRVLELVQPVVAAGFNVDGIDTASQERQLVIPWQLGSDLLGLVIQVGGQDVPREVVEIERGRWD
jgi:hypothetical protein